MSQSTPSKQCALRARIVACTAICREHVRIEVSLPKFPPSAPGQFVQLLCRDDALDVERTAHWPTDGFPSLSGEDLRGRAAYLRRPFSIADRHDTDEGDVRLVFISRAIGVGTAWLDALTDGAELDLTGPLGNGFRLPEEPRPLVLVGGGVGIPPLLYLIRTLHDAGHADVTAILGVTTADLLPVELDREPAADGTPQPCASYPAAARVPTTITTDDGTLGLQGRVTDGLRRWEQLRGSKLEYRPLVLACGPEPMLHAVARWTRAANMDCQLCIERNMGCGIGTCLSCVVRVRDETRPAGWRWALTCTDGPVFARDELLDYSPVDPA